MAFPQDIEVGIRVAQLGRFSARYERGIFAAGKALSAARRHFIHVYVDKLNRKPVPLPENLRDYLQTLCP